MFRGPRAVHGNRRQQPEDGFLFTDAHVADEGFLELINNMLTSGMVPGLYADDEKEGIAGGVRDDCAKAGLGETKEACWRYYVDRCRNNLPSFCHVPSRGHLCTRCRNFPGMVNNTVIDGFTPCPRTRSGPSPSVLRDLDMPDEFGETITEHMVLTHQSVRTTASSFTTSSAVQLRHAQELPRLHRQLPEEPHHAAQAQHRLHQPPRRWSAEAHDGCWCRYRCRKSCQAENCRAGQTVRCRSSWR